jgi:hypothetical protein
MPDRASTDHAGSDESGDVIPGPHTLRLVHRGDDLYDLHVGDLFSLALTYDADDERWSLWGIDSDREGTAQRIGTDHTYGEPMPWCKLVDALGHRS